MRRAAAGYNQGQNRIRPKIIPAQIAIETSSATISETPGSQRRVATRAVGRGTAAPSSTRR
jgi:hypothetical protein